MANVGPLFWLRELSVLTWHSLSAWGARPYCHGKGTPGWPVTRPLVLPAPRAAAVLRVTQRVEVGANRAEEGNNNSSSLLSIQVCQALS